MAIYPAAIRQPLNSHGGPRPQFFGFCHHCETTEGNPWGYFSDPNNGASSHFWVSNLGQVYQFIDTADASWAQMAGNNGYISCEFEGTIATPLSMSQMSAGAALIQWCAKTDGFPIQVCDHGGTGITTHCFYRPPFYPADPAWGNHSCPGPGPRLAQHPIMVNMAAGSITPVLKQEEDVTLYVANKSSFLVYPTGNVVYVGSPTDLANLTAKYGPSTEVSDAMLMAMAWNNTEAQNAELAAAGVK